MRVERQGSSFLGVGPVQKAAELFQTTPENILWNHTAFPYASAFVSEAIYDSAIRTALGPPSGSRKLSGVMQNAKVGIQFRRVCKLCLEDDLARFGETYWHRSHNLPGAFYCTTHKCLLHPTTLPAYGRGLARLPVECELNPSPPAWRSPGAWSLSVASQALLGRTPGLGEQRMAGFYISLAVHLGWLQDKKRVSQPALIRLMQSCFSEAFFAAAAVEFSESRAWPVQAFNPAASNRSPLKHLMVETALRHGSEKPGELSFRSSGGVRANYQAIDDALSTFGEAELQRIISAREGLTREAFLRRIGGMSAYRSYWKKCPKLLAVAQRLQTWNATLPKPTALSAHSPESVQAMDERLAAAAVAQLGTVVAANETLRLDAFMKRIGALKAWKFRKADCPKLVAAAEHVKARNAARAIDARRPNWRARDDRLSKAAEAELRRVIAANEGLTLYVFMKRLGAATAWQFYRSDHPKLAKVARRFLLWKKSRRADARQKNWHAIDDRLSMSAASELEKVMASGEFLTMYDLLRRLKATRVWQHHQSDCPKLVAVAQRCKAWTATRARERRRPDVVERDDRLSKAALAELKRVVASGKRLTLAAFMKRVGACTAWENKKDCPKLQIVAAELRAWNASTATATRQLPRSFRPAVKLSRAGGC